MPAINNNNNINNNASSPPPDAERQEQETIVLWEFRNAFQNCHERLLDDTEVLTNDEHAAIERLYSDPTWYCLGAGLLTLGLLRTGRSMRRYRADRYGSKTTTRSNGGGGYTMDPPFLHGMPPPPQPQIPPNAFRWKTAMVDFFVCTFAGAATGTYLVDMDEAEGGLDELVLVPGRSGIAQQFCPALLEEYQEQWNEQKRQQKLQQMENSSNHNNSMKDHDGEEDNNDSTTTNTATIVDLGVVSVQIKADPIPPQAHKEILEHPHNPNLQAYLRFVQNCKARHAMEGRLRKEWGLSDTASVSIPPPGVVVGMNDDEEDDWESSNSNSSTDVGNGDEEWNQDDVSNWVSDQEDKKP